MPAPMMARSSFLWAFGGHDFFSHCRWIVSSWGTDWGIGVLFIEIFVCKDA
jgi:hypothetical protein